jgi:hypothetical protein
MLALDLDVSITAAIAAGQSLSPQVNLGAKTLLGIGIPASWVTAGLSFQASYDGGASFGELLDQTATAVAVSSVTGGAVVFIAIDPTKLRGVNCIKVRSGTSAAPVVQTTGATLTLILRSVF